MKNIAIIPARSGSKGLRDKNIKMLYGKPLMTYTIEAAREANIFDEIFVSTDSVQYAGIAKEYGASVPFLRSEASSTDTASSWDVVKEVIENYNRRGIVFDTVALLQPTSPLRTAEDILLGYEEMKYKEANAIVSVCEVDHSPLWCNNLPKDHSLCHFINRDLINVPRQKLDPYYRINGALYIVKLDYLMTAESIYQDRCYAVVMKKENSVDIDDEMDFKIAETIISERDRKMND